ncbi:MAG: TonB family protein [Chitinophagaceae bacterium]|nr:TonB family protein [Chitinophagaceae bacterium]
MKLTFVLGLCIFYCSAQSQQVKQPDTAYFNRAGRKTNHRDSAEFYTVRHYNPEDSNRVRMTKQAMNGQLLGENYFSNFKKLIKEGTSREYHSSGALAKEISYVNNKIEGLFLTYWPDGKIRRRDLCRNDTLVTGQCYTREGNDTIYFEYEQPPKFPGGQDSLRKFIGRNLKYPPNARLDAIEGTVYVLFTVTKEGSVTEVKIYKAVSPELDAEAIRVVSRMPPWMPRKLEGELTPYNLVLPVAFRLE